MRYGLGPFMPHMSLLAVCAGMDFSFLPLRLSLSEYVCSLGSNA